MTRAPLRIRWLRPRFGMRALLVFVLVCGALCGWLAIRLSEKNRALAAVDAIGRIEDVSATWGMKIQVGPQPGRGEMNWLKDLFDCEFLSLPTDLHISGPITDAGLQNIDCLPFLKELGISHAELTKNNLGALSGLRQLESLYLGSLDGRAESDFEFLEQMPSLKCLELKSLRPTSLGWRRIKHLPRLEKLRLLLTFRNDEFGQLKDLKQLKELDISYCLKTDDAGLDELRGLKQLDALNVGYCFPAFSDAALERFQRAVPKCAIVK